MTAQNPYTVETRSQGAVILCDSPELGSLLAAEFRHLSLDPLLIIPGEGSDVGVFVSELTNYCLSHDLDYLLTILTPRLSTWLNTLGSTFWNLLQTQGEESNFLIATRPWDSQGSILELPDRAQHILLGEYLDRAGEGAPTLMTLLTSALTRGRLELPGDGVLDYSLLPLADLASALVHVAVTPRAKSGRLTLANPETLSLLNLAHTISLSLSKPVQITFNADFPLKIFTYDWEKILLLHAKYGIMISGKIDSGLEAFLYEFSSSKLPSPEAASISSVSTSPSLTPSPRLTPLSPSRATPPIFSRLPMLPKFPKLPKKLNSASPDSSLVFIPQVSGSKSSLRFPRLFSKSQHPLRGIILRGLGIALAIYLGTLAFAGTIVGLHLRSLSKTLESGNYDALKVSRLTRFSGVYLDANIVALASLPVLNQLTPVQDIKDLTNLYTQGLVILQTTKNLSDSAKQIASYVLTDQGGDIAASFSSARLYSQELYERLSLLDGNLPIEAPTLIASHQASYTKLKTSLGLLKKNLVTGKALLAAGPDLIALGSKAKYVVLLQNNMELRATGGFIGSLALVSFENGRLYDLSVYDVYSADGQLKGHVEPPGPIKDILGEANWYLRDSNFDPDFPTSARRAEWFIKKTLNFDVDGTVGVTLDLLKALLKATGPLELPDYQETVSEGNIYERAQYHAEVNFFPGSTAKKEFLSSVADALFAKVQHGGGVDTLKLVSALSSSLDSKNIQISVLNPTVEHVFSTLSWNGQLSDPPCPGSSACLKDYLYLVDSNFGVNKANYYVSRNLNLTLNVSKEGTLSHVFKARYRNSATSTAWPAGPYKNYARLYLPIGSTLDSLTLSGLPLSPKDYTLSEEHGKLVVAFLLTVPINSELELAVSYTTPGILGPDALYTWFWQKQPGTPVAEPLNLTLNYPLFLKPSVVSPSGDLTPQQLHFDFKNDADHRVTVKFSK